MGDDILSVGSYKVGEISVLMAIVGGKIVYDESNGIFS